MAKIFLDPKKNGKLFSAAFAKCCNEILVSTHRHDFTSCSCGAVFVDGGYDYFRAGGDMNKAVFLPPFISRPYETKVEDERPDSSLP